MGATAGRWEASPGDTGIERSEPPQWGSLLQNPRWEPLSKISSRIFTGKAVGESVDNKGRVLKGLGRFP